MLVTVFLSVTALRWKLIMVLERTAPGCTARVMVSVLLATFDRSTLAGNQEGDRCLVIRIAVHGMHVVITGR